MRFRTALVLAATAAALLAGTPGVFAATRLEVAFISREPRLPPPASLAASVEEGWPDAGSRVHWVAHVLNRGDGAVEAVPYTWSIDGVVVDAGTVTVPQGESTVWLPWRWTFDRHAISFALHPASGDATATDDRLTVVSDALSVGFWVEQGLYDWLAEGGRPGFERWAQGQLDSWNAILARGVFPTAPEGARDRLRLDRIIVLPTGGQVRNGEMDTDVAWAFWNERGDARFLQRGSNANVVADQTIVLHEMLHQRGLIDLYDFNVYHSEGGGPDDNRVDIQENGRAVVGGAAMPALQAGPTAMLVYRAPIEGLMGTRYRSNANLTEHCTNGLNLNAGRRTPQWLDQWGNLIVGFSNALHPDSYVWRLPRRTELRLVDQQGAPVTGASVDVYLDSGPQAYRKRFGPRPDRTLPADERGVAVLPGDLFEDLRKQVLPKASVVILGVKTAAARAYVFIPVYELNLLYFRQGPERAEMEVKVKLVPW